MGVLKHCFILNKIHSDQTFFCFYVHVIDVDRRLGVKMCDFIKCQVKMKAYPEELLKLALEVLCLVPKDYKDFSTMGFIHSDFRNRLGVQKVEKLTFVMRYLNDNESIHSFKLVFLRGNFKHYLKRFKTIDLFKINL